MSTPSLEGLLNFGLQHNGKFEAAQQRRVAAALEYLLDAITDGESDLTVSDLEVDSLTINPASGNPIITFKASDTSRTALFPISTVEFVMQPVSSNQSYLYIVPKGTNTSGQYIFSTDYIADSSNWEAIIISKASGDKATINVNKGGTGTYRNLEFKTNNTVGLTLDTSSNLTINNGTLFVKSYTVAGVPAATTAGGVIYVSNEAGGAVLAFSDGTNWRRVTDRAVIS